MGQSLRGLIVFIGDNVDDVFGLNRGCFRSGSLGYLDVSQDGGGDSGSEMYGYELIEGIQV